MAFLSIIFSSPDTLYENIIAELSDTDIESYYETEALIAYVKEESWSDDLKARLDSLSNKYSITYELELLKDINWNSVWESNFNPVSIGDFCHVRAAFHPEITGFKHVIEISPKMAFGTGHHETTAMMIERMEELDLNNANVLDFGCGTGILATLAAKIGASSVEAIDIDSNAIDNTKEHLKLNQVSNVIVNKGDLDVCSRKTYNLILANINRNVLMDKANHLYTILEENGTLLISGILETDKNRIEEKYLNSGFKRVNMIQKGEWLCFQFVKSNNS